MKLRKRFAAAALAAMMTGTCITSSAFAETQEKKLYVSPVETTLSFDGNFFSLNDGTLAYMSDSQLESWKKTGEFNYSEVKTDFDTSEIISYQIFNGKGWVAQKINGKNCIKLVTFDEDTCTLHTTKELQNFNRANSVGVLTSKYNTNSCTFTLYYIDGTEKSFDLDYTTSDNSMWFGYSVNANSKYDAAIIWQSGRLIIENLHMNKYKYVIYGIKKDGNPEVIYKSGDECDVGEFGSILLGKNCVSWLEDGAYHVKIFETGEEIVIDSYSIDGPTCKTPSFGEQPANHYYVQDVFGNKMITRYTSDVTGEEDEYRYVLLDKNKLASATEDNKCKPDSKSYKSMSSEDGKIFSVTTEDDKYGFIDANGNELGFFDDAGTFAGNYAPVVKDGKAYLIDRNMNCISEKIDADSVATYSDGCERFLLVKDDKDYIVAISDAAAAPTESETSETPDTSGDSESTNTSSALESTNTSSAPETSDTSSVPQSAGSSDSSSDASDKADNKNTATGAIVGVALAAIALAGGAVIVSRKKK